MGQRSELSTILRGILGSDNVYFQPPESIKMSYPAIRYSAQPVGINKANDKPYKVDTSYEVIIIDRNPDSTYWKDMIDTFSYCRVNSIYTSQNLTHWVLTIYY